jgi:hypothetical protein
MNAIKICIFQETTLKSVIVHNENSEKIKIITIPTSTPPPVIFPHLCIIFHCFLLLPYTSSSQSVVHRTPGLHEKVFSAPWGAKNQQWQPNNLKC